MTDSAGPGYVYALINPAMPGLVKVGLTTRRPADRAAELSGATGVPTAFELVYDVLVPDCAAGERYVHQALAARGYRLTDNREFFRAPLREVVGLLVGLRELMAAEAVGARQGAADDAPPMASPGGSDGRDPLFSEAAAACIEARGGSTSLLQRRLKIGYGRAAALIDQLHRAGVLGPADGANPRPVLIGADERREPAAPQPGQAAAPNQAQKSRWAGLLG